MDLFLQLLNVKDRPESKLKKAKGWKEKYEILTSVPVEQCTISKKSKMRVVERIAPIRFSDRHKRIEGDSS